MMNISIRDLSIYAYHGVFEQERRTGQPFRIDCDLAFDPSGTILALEQTIDYTSIITLIRSVMAEPEPLLETVAQHIADRIRREHPVVRIVDISIEKCAPPIPSFGGRVGVRFRKDYL